MFGLAHNRRTHSFYCSELTGSDSALFDTQYRFLNAVKSLVNMADTVECDSYACTYKPYVHTCICKHLILRFISITVAI